MHINLKGVVPTYFGTIIYAQESKMDYYTFQKVCVYENTNGLWNPSAKNSVLIYIRLMLLEPLRFN